MPDPTPAVTDALRKGMMSTVEESFLEWVKRAYYVLEESAVDEWENEQPNFTDAVGRAKRSLQYNLWLRQTMLGLVDEVCGGPK